MVVVAVDAGGGGWCRRGRVVNVVVDRWHAGGGGSRRSVGAVVIYWLRSGDCGGWHCVIIIVCRLMVGGVF